MQNNAFELSYATTHDIKNIINSLKTDKATGSDRIPAKFVTLPVNVTDSDLTDIINRDIPQNNYSENSKTATVRPIFKSDDIASMKN